MRLVSLLAAILLAVPVFAAAQPMPAIHPGQTVTGELAEGDLQNGDGVLYDLWRFRAPEEGPYLINLRSDDFDALIQVGSYPGEARCEDCREDDDGGEGLNAQVVYPALAGAWYAILVRSYASGRGRYSLSLERGENLWGVDTAVAVVPVMDTTMVMDTTVVDGPPIPYLFLTPGEPVHGALADGDASLDEAYADIYRYDASGGETVTITVQSGDFDTYVDVGRSSYETGWVELGSDDDGGEGTDSRLTVTFPAWQRYDIRVRGFSREAEGAYTVLLESHGIQGMLSTTDTTVTVPAIRHGERVEGTLDSGEDNSADRRYFDVYSFHGRAGETVTISLRSEDFDAYLFIGLARTGEKVVTDDDGGAGTDSQVTFTLPESGEYLIRATSLAPDEEGAYVLTLDGG